MEEFLASPYFRYAIFPIASVAIGIAVKCVSRNDRYTSFRKEDMAVGLELMLTAALLFVALTTDRALTLIGINSALADVLASTPLDTTRAIALQGEVQEISSRLASAGWLILVLFIGLWSISTLVRKWGWKSENELTPVVGIAIPLVFGILALVAVMAGAVK